MGTLLRLEREARVAADAARAASGGGMEEGHGEESKEKHDVFRTAILLSQGWVHSGYQRAGLTICLDILS